ncbi:uncharacterized protein LOC115230613 [Argonauta hians]
MADQTGICSSVMEPTSEVENFQKKKKRRSSFTPGRAKQFQNDNFGITCEIKADLSPDLKLAELVKTCCKHAFDILQEEISPLQNLNMTSIESDVLSEIDAMTDENVFYDLYHKQSCPLNPLSQQLDSTISKYKSFINNLGDESTCWDEMKQKTRKMASDAELQNVKKLKNYEDLPEAVLNASEKYLPSIEFDLTQCQEIVNQSLMNADVAVDYFKNACNILQVSAKDVQLQAEALQLLYAKNEYSTLTSSMQDTPRKLLSRVMKTGNQDEKSLDSNEFLQRDHPPNAGTQD